MVTMVTQTEAWKTVIENYENSLENVKMCVSFSLLTNY